VKEKPVKNYSFKPRRGSGDGGYTDLLGGRRVPKTSRRVKLNALLDELGALLGLLRAGEKKTRRAGLEAAQAALVKAAGVIAGRPADLGAEQRALEALIDKASARLKPAKKFVLPGENEAEALAHLARARARLCELAAWDLKAEGPAVYLNRLSDYLFLLGLERARAPR
jgi:cob(I)alamin adenosyltransferase